MPFLEATVVFAIADFNGDIILLLLLLLLLPCLLLLITIYVFSCV